LSSTRPDAFIPLGDAARLVLLDEPTIEAAARSLASAAARAPRGSRQ
jgi:hypothetical protein